MTSLALSEVATIRGGGRLKLSGRDFVATGVPAYGAGGLNGYVDAAEDACEAIILASVGTCGRCYFVNGPWTSMANTQVIIPDARKVDARFLWHQLNDETSWPRSGTNQLFIKPSDVRARLVDVPPLAEQQRIAAVLDHADLLRAKRRSALVLLDSLPRSIHRDMFGRPDPTWTRAPLGAVTECLDARRRPVKESDRVPGPVPYYGANGQQGWIDQPLFDEPLVLVAEDGGHFGTPERGVAYRVEGPAWVNNHAHILRPGPELDIEYLHRTLRHYDFRPYISGTTRSKLNQKQLKAAEIWVPPLASQRVFAQRSLAAVGLHRAQDAAVRELESLIRTLRTRFFTRRRAAA